MPLKRFEISEKYGNRDRHARDHPCVVLRSPGPPATADDLLIGGADDGYRPAFGVQQRVAQWVVVLRVVGPHLR
jgi:hypothetical protein